MNLRFRGLLLVVVACLFLASSSHAVVPPIPKMPSHYVVDLAGIINDDVENRLNGYLQELEQKTTAQFIILTIQSLEGEPIEDFSLSTANDKWKLGHKGKDNGFLFVVAIYDRKYRFEVGYGLEGILPDSLVGGIGRQFLVQNFRDGNYSTGIYQATLAVINEIASHEGVEITGMPIYHYDDSSQGRDLADIIRGILYFILTVILILIVQRLINFFLFLPVNFFFRRLE